MYAHRWEKLRDYVLPALLVIVLFIGMVYFRPGEIPPLWFDEGWSLTVARNWVETGQYARLLEGIPISAKGMARPISVTAPIALSFYCFGVGVWQARLPASISMVLALYLLFRLVHQLYGYKMAYLALFALLFMSLPPANPLLIGRQAIAEAPLALFLITGFYAFLAVLNGNNWAILGVILSWGLALDSKGHTFPFWSISILTLLIFSIVRKEWRVARLILIIGIASLFIYFTVNTTENALIGDLPAYGSPMKGLYLVTAFILDPELRIIIFRNFILHAIPVIVGLGYTFIQHWRKFCSPVPLSSRDYVELALLAMTSSWLAWFFLFSIGWGRYFFPVSFLGSIFVAQIFSMLLKNMKQLVNGELKNQLQKRVILYIGLTIFICILVVNGAFLKYQISQENNGAVNISEYIQEHINPNALIETYDSELLFLIDNPVHYPPDQIQVELNKRYFLRQDIQIPYDASIVDFDFLVVGPYSSMWQIYTPMLAQDQLDLVFSVDGYSIYRKIP